MHISTLLLGAAAPSNDDEFLYAEEAGGFAGQARCLLAAAGVSSTGKSAEATLAEFQRAGFLLTYVLECPLDRTAGDPAALQALLSARLPALAARVRRSLRPKRLVPISRSLEPLLANLETIGLGCPMVLDGNKPFDLDVDKDAQDAPDRAVERLRQALSAASAPAR